MRREKNEHGIFSEKIPTLIGVVLIGIGVVLGVVGIVFFQGVVTYQSLTHLDVLDQLQRGGLVDDNEIQAVLQRSRDIHADRKKRQVLYEFQEEFTAAQKGAVGGQKDVDSEKESFSARERVLGEFLLEIHSAPQQ